MRRFLISLYPPHWRQRYGEEFARLLEDTPLSAAVITNVLFAAGRSWLMETPLGWFAWAASVSGLASVVARYASGVYPGEEAPIVAAFVGWPLYLLFLFVAVRRTKIFGRKPAVDESQFLLWILVFFVATIASQWSAIAQSHLPPSDFDLWQTYAVILCGVFAALRNNAAASRQDLDTST